jgi:hypothetical protein
MQAAENAGRTDEVAARIRSLLARETAPDRFVTRILGSTLGLATEDRSPGKRPLS